ncbi:MAG: ribosomal-processing cysteine protease Prp [Acutalibacteraceae bacterium]|nr:ribosomal-processing cysteine protease Prp [Acutalibacteraceae bacterium]
MTEVKFLADKSGIYGFYISGHSSVNCDDIEGKIVCSAVSSAAYMTANTITEIIGDKMEAQVDDALLFVKVISPSAKSSAVLEGFRLHIEQLSSQYNDRISIISEV